METEDSEEEPSWTTFNPLLSHHIVEIIFDHCTPKTLRTCRLVCQTWNLEATRTMEIREVTAFVKGENAIGRFLDCMEKANGLPFCAFSIDLHSDYLRDQSKANLIYQLLNLLKDKLKKLKLEYELPQVLEDGELNVSPFTDLKEVNLPNLHTLHLFSTNIFPPQPSSDQNRRTHTIFENFVTPNLANLTIQHLYPDKNADLVVKYLEQSRRVSSLRMSSAEFLKAVPTCTSSAIKNLRELDICDLFHGTYATNETIDCIKKCCPRLESLSIELGCRVIFAKVYDLFVTLSPSLTQLKLLIQDKNLLSRHIQPVNLYFPQMPKLTKLFLRYANPGLVYYIDAMPQLSWLELETPWTRKVRGHVFPGIQTKAYESLRTLNISERLTGLTLDDVQLIQKLYPNLTTLCASFKSDEALHEVYRNCKKLVSLIVDRNSTVGDEGIVGELTEVEKSTFTPDNIQSLTGLQSLKLVQMGLSWKSLAFGVCRLPNLTRLAVQTTTLKKQSHVQLTEDDTILQLLSKTLVKLQTLSIWIRRNVERLTEDEMNHLQSHYAQWDVEICLSVCSTAA